MKKQIPMLFSTPMVIAADNETKTITRRVIKSLVIDKDSGYVFLEKKYQFDIHNWKEKLIPFCPYGEVGDIIYVRETFAVGLSSGFYFFKANYTTNIAPTGLSKWKPSIHMPKKIARIWLEITDIRIEQLDDISEGDAKQEGIKRGNCYADGFMHYDTKTFGAHPVISFQTLWESINKKKHTWKSNPWVWVITFKKTTKPVGNN